MRRDGRRGLLLIRTWAPSSASRARPKHGGQRLRALGAEPRRRVRADQRGRALDHRRRRGDSELTSLIGSWTGTTPITITRRWQRCTSGGLSCADIPGAVGEKYTPTLADVLAQIRVMVTASNVAGTVSAPSALVGPVPQPGGGTGGGGSGGSGGGGAPATPAGPPTPSPVAALAATVKAPAKAKLAAALAGKLAVPVGCSAACTVAARIELAKKAAKKLGVPAVLARGTARLAAAGRANVKLKFVAKARKKLRKARTVAGTLVVEVRDATGALAAQRRSKLTLRR